VKDLAVAFKMMLGNDKARGQIYNISGERYSTGLAWIVQLVQDIGVSSNRNTPLSMPACLVKQLRAASSSG
jgi:uncharacterized membrane protein